MVSPMVLLTIGRRAPTIQLGLGALRPTVGNTVGETVASSGRFPMNVRRVSLLDRGWAWRPSSDPAGLPDYS